MKRHYADTVEVNQRLRALVEAAHLDLQLEPDPAEPTTVEELNIAMNTVRTNMFLVEMCLNDWDHATNGCELRPRTAIQDDIDQDMRLLARPILPEHPRSRDKIQANIAYDKMQLKRS